jgi:hypothetical protein
VDSLGRGANGIEKHSHQTVDSLGRGANGIEKHSRPWIASGEEQTVYKSIATWTGLWKPDQLHMVLLRVGAGGAWKLQPEELGSFRKGSLEASKRGVWRLRFPKGSVGNRGVSNLRLIGLVGLGPASRVFTFHLLDSLLTATAKMSISPHMTSYSNT